MSFFVVPLEGDGTKGNSFRPKYIPALGVDWAMVDHDTNGIVWADATPAQETAVAANPDAIVVPPLDNSVAVVATQNALEALNIPAQWITAGMTYRDVLRALIGAAQLIQRTSGLGFKLKLVGNLDLTMSQIPANIRNALATAADQLGLDRSSILGTTTVRQALRILGAQFVSGIGVRLGPL